MIFQDPMSSLNPVYRVGWQIVEQIRTHNPQISKRRRDGPGGRADGACRRPARGRAAALLPARVLRRHAPARDDRDGALLLAEAADRRRADHGARRHDPGADPRRAAPAARGDQRRRSSWSPTTSRSSPTSPTASSSCTPGAWSSRARSTSSSTTRSTPTPGACSARSRGSTATAARGCRRSPGRRRRCWHRRQGCHFQPRCPHAFDQCDQVPALESRIPEAPEHLDRCWLERREQARAARGRRPDRARQRCPGDLVRLMPERARPAGERRPPAQPAPRSRPVARHAHR